MEVRVRFVALMVVVVTAVGCGGAAGNLTTASTQSTTGEQTTARTTESTAGQKTTTGEAVASSAPTDSDASDAGKRILDYQLEEASKYNADPIKQGQFVDGVYQEAEKRGVDPEQVLYERGYDCGWSALQQSAGKK